MREHLYRHEVKILGAAVSTIGDSDLRDKICEQVGKVLEGHTDLRIVGEIEGEHPDFDIVHTFDWDRWNNLCDPKI